MLSEAECVGVGTFHSKYNSVQKVRYPPESLVFTGGRRPRWARRRYVPAWRRGAETAHRSHVALNIGSAYFPKLML
ncbi:hypothetical protein EVAR_20717_1 [Eumeta japonica]|uniref:Uncharacterized protein n=1 Tax=Eumeta variegata TaxID=151549 RepID=A0A4C1VBL6_EUMVA|nr:hypothetical protein EVAR_20717_1 [Eumeta japonica]